MPRSVTGMTAFSCQRTLLQRTSNLLLSLDKVSLRVSFQHIQGQQVFIKSQYVLMGSHGAACDRRTDEVTHQQANQNPLIKLVFHSAQLTSSSDCITVYLGESTQLVRHGLNPRQEIHSESVTCPAEIGEQAGSVPHHMSK